MYLIYYYTMLFCAAFLVGVTVIVFIILFTINCIKNKKYLRLTGFVLACVLLSYVVLSTNYVKMRIPIKPKALYGMTLEDVQKKYYCIEQEDCSYADEGYVFCAAYLYRTDFDGPKFYERYYVKPDKNGVVEDVKMVMDN